MTNAREIVAMMRSPVDLSDLKVYAESYQRIQKDAVDFVKGLKQSIEQSRALNALVQTAQNVQLAARESARGFRVPVGGRAVLGEPRPVASPPPSFGVEKQIGVWAGAVKTAVGKSLGLDTVKDILLAGDEFNQVQARLSIVANGGQEKQLIDERLRTDSQQARQPFSSSADFFLNIHSVMQNQGKTTQDSLDLVEAANLSLTASAADPQKASVFLTQFAQDLVQGRLSGEGFQNMLVNNQRMLMHLIKGLNEINPSLGVSSQNLFELTQQGLITSDLMGTALVSQLTIMRQEVAKLPVSLSSSLTQFSDKLARVSGELQQQTGIVTALNAALKMLGDHLGQIVHLLWLVGMAYGLRKLELGMVGLLGNSQSLTQSLRALVGVAGAFARELWVAVRPFLRWMIIVEAISLVVQDVMAWFQGGDSILGSIIGRSEQWQAEIDAVSGALMWVKDLLGGGADTLDDWLDKWGGIATVVVGLVMLIGGIPALIVTLVALLLSYREEIVTFAKEFWDTFVLAAEQTWVEIKATFTRMFDWFEEQFAKVGDFFSSLVPEIPSLPSMDSVKNFLGFEAPAPAASKQAGGQYSDNRTMTVNVTTQDNPAAISAAVGKGMAQAPSLATPRTGSLGFGVPNAEAAP